MLSKREIMNEWSCFTMTLTEILSDCTCQLAATTSDIKDARATRNLPRSPRRIHNPALKMREYSRRFSRRLFQASNRSPPRPAARASERGLRYMARREIFSKYDVNGRNNTFPKMSQFKNTYLLVFLLPPGRSLIV